MPLASVFSDNEPPSATARTHADRLADEEAQRGHRVARVPLHPCVHEGEAAHPVATIAQRPTYEAIPQDLKQAIFRQVFGHSPQHVQARGRNETALYLFLACASANGSC